MMPDRWPLAECDNNSLECGKHNHNNHYFPRVIASTSSFLEKNGGNKQARKTFHVSMRALWEFILIGSCVTLMHGKVTPYLFLRLIICPIQDICKLPQLPVSLTVTMLQEYTITTQLLLTNNNFHFHFWQVKVCWTFNMVSLLWLDNIHFK